MSVWSQVGHKVLNLTSVTWLWLTMATRAYGSVVWRTKGQGHDGAYHGTIVYSCYDLVKHKKIYRNNYYHKQFKHTPASVSKTLVRIASIEGRSEWATVINVEINLSWAVDMRPGLKLSGWIKIQLPQIVQTQCCCRYWKYMVHYRWFNFVCN